MREKYSTQQSRKIKFPLCLIFIYFLILIDIFEVHHQINHLNFKWRATSIVRAERLMSEDDKAKPI